MEQNESLAVLNKDIVKKSDSLDYAISKFNQMQQVATMLMKATGFLPQHLKSPEMVMAVMIKSKELGIPMMEGLSSLYPVNGRIAMMTQLMNALVRRSGLLDGFKIDYDKVDMVATCTVKRKGEDEIVTSFSIEEARRADLLKKDNWKYYPKDCLIARAQSRAFKLVFPDVLGSMVYTPDEMDVETTLDDSGDEAFTGTTYFDEESTYNRLMDTLVAMNKKRVDYLAYEQWLAINKEDVGKLSEAKRNLIRKEFARGTAKFQKKEVVSNGIVELHYEQHGEPTEVAVGTGNREGDNEHTGTVVAPTPPEVQADTAKS